MTVFSQVWSCAPRFQRPITEFNQNYSMMLGHCFGYSARDGFRRSDRVVPLEDEVCCAFACCLCFGLDTTVMLGEPTQKMLLV